jgi:hypothetical protein
LEPPGSEPSPVTAPHPAGRGQAVGDDASNGPRKDTAPA